MANKGDKKWVEWQWERKEYKYMKMWYEVILDQSSSSTLSHENGGGGIWELDTYDEGTVGGGEGRRREPFLRGGGNR